MASGTSIAAGERAGLDLAWEALTPEEREFLGQNRFQRMLELMANGHKEREMYRLLWGANASDIRGLRGELTRRLKAITRRTEIREYLDRTGRGLPGGRARVTGRPAPALNDIGRAMEAGRRSDSDR